MTSDALDLERVRALCGARAARRGQRIQRLWSGYGELVRVHLEGAEVSSVVVKSVQPPDGAHHPPGRQSDHGHARKLRSYQVERQFYERCSPLCTPACRVPALVGAWSEGSRSTFVLEDLDAGGFDLRRRRLSEAELQACIAWLAAFHARFLGQPTEGLWPVGTYWHLDTRPDELAAMDHPRLQAAAPAIDARLRGARHRTLVHGDAKVANFCFSADGRVAAVDFQYVGGGCGVQDLAYLLSSCLDDATLRRREPALVDRYFERLRSHLDASTAGEVEAEWRALLPWAWADFVRFLAGWDPHHWKLERHALTHTEHVLRQLGG